MVGRDFFSKLPADVQAAVREAGVAASKVIGDYVDAEDDGFVKNFAKAGVKVIEPDIKQFRAKLEGFVAKYSPEMAKYADEMARVQ